VIVVIGSPSLRSGPDVATATGLAARIALAAAAEGASVQLVGKVGDDPAGDALLLALSAGGVGHVAILRDPTRATPEDAAPVAPGDGGGETGATEVREATGILEAAGILDDPTGAPTDGDVRSTRSIGPALEAADLELGLRYLVDYQVVVAAEPLEARAAQVVAEAASFAGAHLVALLPPGVAAPDAFASSTVLEAPRVDPDDALAQLVAAYAIALDAGAEPGPAFRRIAADMGWEAAGT
jgi:hypothetical protein